MDASGRELCGGTGVALHLLPSGTHGYQPKNNIPFSKAFTANVDGVTYHLQNVALLPWYTGASDAPGNITASRMHRPLRTMPSLARQEGEGLVRAARTHRRRRSPPAGAPNGHRLIGYWAG